LSRPGYIRRKLKISVISVLKLLANFYFQRKDSDAIDFWAPRKIDVALDRGLV